VTVITWSGLHCCCLWCLSFACLGIVVAAFGLALGGLCLCLGLLNLALHGLRGPVGPSTFGLLRLLHGPRRVDVAELLVDQAGGPPDEAGGDGGEVEVDLGPGQRGGAVYEVEELFSEDGGGDAQRAEFC